MFLNKIKNGNTYAFEVGEHKYGLIQVFNKSQAGYRVRVFYDVIDSFDESTVNALIQSKDFYYINNFSKYELNNRSYKLLGKYDIPTFVSIPEYTRTSERKPSGKLFWYIIDKKGTTVEKLDKFDEKLMSLSPEESWGIDYVIKRWQDGFTLEKWNDELENYWYHRYLKVYEPNKLKEIDLSNTNLKNLIPTNAWVVDARESDGVIEVHKCLEHFTDNVLSNDSNKLLKQTVETLNRVNDKYGLIDTMRAEEIVGFIDLVFRANKIDFDQERIDSQRSW